MAGNIEKQIEKEIEQFLKDNWKGIVPLAVLGGGAWITKKNMDTIQSFWSTIFPYVKTGVITLGSAGILFLILMIVRSVIVRKKEKGNYMYFRLIPRTNQPVKPHEVSQLVKQFATIKRGRKNRFLKGREWFQWLIHHNKEGICFYIGCPRDQKKEVLQSLQNCYPEAELHESEVIFPSKGSFSGRMRVKKHRIKQWMPFTSYEGGDAVGSLLSFMPINSWLSIDFSAVSRKRIGKKLFKAEKELKKDKKLSEMYSFEKERFKDITNRLSGDSKAFQLSISLAGEGTDRRDIVKSIGRNISSILSNKNNLLFKRHHRAIQYCPHPRKHLLFLTNNELSNLLHLPDMTHNISEKIEKLENGQHNLDSKELNEGLTVGYNLHPIVSDREVKIPLTQLTEMFFLSGQTGSGKSSLLIMMLQSLIDQWLEKPLAGFTMLDPAGATARTILNRLMVAEVQGKTVDWSKVIYVSYKNGDSPIGLNLFQKNAGESTHVVVENAMGLFKSLFPGDKTRIDKYLSNTMTVLVDDIEKHSVLGVNRFLTEPSFRKKLVARIKDPILKDFWEKADPKEVKQIANDVYSRVNMFEQSLFMRRMFGQTSWDLKIKQYMDDGYIVLFDIQGMNSPAATKMIAGHIINQYHQIAQMRTPYSSKEHLIILDEAHLVQVPILEKIIAEDRKFSISLGISTQYIEQLNDNLRAAIDGNVQNIFSGSQGFNQSKIMSDLMKKQFDPQMLAQLPNNNAAILTKNKDKSLTTCLVKSTLPYLYLPDGTIAKHKNEHDTNIVEAWVNEKANELQSRIGRNVEEIDQKINDYYGFKVKVGEDFFEEETEEKIQHTGGLTELETEKVETEENEFPMPSLSEKDFVIIKEENTKETENDDKKKGVETEREESFF